MNPAQHLHSNPPLVLIQVELTEHLSVPLAHSLMSTSHLGPSNLRSADSASAQCNPTALCGHALQVGGNSRLHEDDSSMETWAAIEV